MVKGRECHSPFLRFGVKEKISFHHDKSKKKNRKNKHYVQCPDIPSTIRPISLDSDRPVPELDANMEYTSYSELSDMTVLAYKSGVDD